jgi:hypothetical protein
VLIDCFVMREARASDVITRALGHLPQRLKYSRVRRLHALEPRLRDPARQLLRLHLRGEPQQRAEPRSAPGLLLQRLELRA